MIEHEEEIESEEEVKEEKLTLKSLKKEFDLFKEEIFKRLPMQPLMPVHGVAPRTNPSDVAKPAEPAENAIIFHFHDRFKESRAFSEETHGPDWHQIADDFQYNNQTQIKKREDI